MLSCCSSLGMALNFVVIIPSLDTHLEKKYKKRFREYAKKTRRLPPSFTECTDGLSHV